MALTKVQSEMAGAGQVLQVVTSFVNTVASTGSTTPVTTGLSVSITPKSATSKILVLTDAKIGGTSGNLRFAALAKNGSLISQGATSGGRQLGALEFDGSSNALTVFPLSSCYVDSPATTSAVTYAVYFWVYANGTVYLNQTGTDRDPNDIRTGSSITVLEIAA